jgi:hypothetical protein
MESASEKRWAAIVGWEGYYEISSEGEVRSVLRAGEKINRDYGGRLLAPVRCKNGYSAVNLTKPGLRRQVLVHRAVLKAFSGSPPMGMEACHNNGDRSDNRLANLRWDTRKNNHADKIAHGTWQAGSLHPGSVITEAVAREIKISLSSGNTIDGTARSLAVSRHIVADISCGRTWRGA